MTQTKRASGAPWKGLGLALGAGLAIILVGLAACGGDDSGGSKTTAATGTGAAGTGVANKTPSGGGENASAKLQNLSKDWSKVTAKVTYKFSSTFQNQTTDTTMTLYSRPPDSRIDYDAGAQGRSIFIDSGGKSYICSQQGNEGQCFSTPSTSSGSPLPFFGDFAGPDTIDKAVAGLAGVNIDSFTDKIAGQDVNCFKASGTFTAETGQASWCFTDDGLLLSSSFGGGSDKFEMKATEVSKSVSDKDLEPPFKVVEIPSGQ